MSSQHRKAALSIYNLTASDRDWILHQLPSHQRFAIEMLLAELGAMKIPPGLLPLAVTNPPLPNAAKDELSRTDPYHALDQCKTSLVWSTLSAEQNEVIAVILAFRVWRWHAAVLKQFTSSRRAEIIKLTGMINQKVSFAMQCCIVSAFAGKLGLPLIFDIDYSPNDDLIHVDGPL